MKGKTGKKLTGILTAVLLAALSVLPVVPVNTLAAAPDATVKGQGKTYAQFNDEIASALEKMGEDQVGLIEVQAKPFVSIGGKTVKLLGEKKATVLCIHYDSNGSEKDLVLTSADAALADEKGFIGFEYAFQKHIADEAEAASAAGVTLPEGVEPVTWEPSSSDLIIKGEEAAALYKMIKAGEYPPVEYFKASEITSQIDSLSTYYKGVYGNTLNIDTEERKELREDIRAKFLSEGSARTKYVDPSSKRHVYAYDGPLAKDYQMELVLGLPASGKSTRVTDPDSEAMKAFILDCDEVKELIPEFRQSYGAAADAVHFESFEIMNEAMKEFTEGSLKGTNVIIPIVAGDFDDLMNSYIKPFEDAGYNVRCKFVEADSNASVSRNIMRELETGRIINSAVVFSFGTAPEEVYKKLAPMTNAKGVHYGYEYENTEEANAE